MLRTLRTKVSGHRLRREPGDAATPTPPPRRTLRSLRRTTLSKPPAPHDWRGEDGIRVHVHTTITTPDLIPDTSPDSSSPASLPTPHHPKTPSALETLGGDARKADTSYADVTLHTVVLHQHPHPEAPTLSHAMINNIWDVKDVQEEATFGLGITAPHLQTGELSPFPTSEQLQSLLALNSPRPQREEPTTPVSVCTEELARLQELPPPPTHLTIKKMPESPSILSIKTVDTQGSLGLHSVSPSSAAPQGFMALMQDTGFPSPPIRAQAPDLLDGHEAGNATTSSAEPSRSHQDQAPPQTTPAETDKKPAGLRHFALSAAVETSSLAQRRKARFTQAKPLSRPLSLARNLPEPPITPIMAQSFKDKYPPALIRRRPMLGALPPTPVSATMHTAAAAAAAQRPPHLSPHLSLEEAVQMSLGSEPRPISRNTAGRRVSSLMYLRDGKPIAAVSGGSSPLARATPTLDAIRTSGGPLFIAGSLLHSDSPRSSGLRTREGTPDNSQGPVQSHLTESPEDFHTPALPWTPTVAQAAITRPVHPPNMACLAGCCARPTDFASSPATFHPIKAPTLSRLARVSSMTSQHSRMLSNGSGFKIPEIPKVPALPKPHQVKKAQSSPELKMDFKRPRPSMQEERPSGSPEETMHSNKRKKHASGKKNKSISSLRFLTRAFSKEPQLPTNASTKAVAHDAETRSMRRISVDSNESWGPTNGDLCLPDLPPQTFIAFQALPTPPVSSPIVPSMGLRRPSQGSPLGGDLKIIGHTEQPLAHDASATPAKILQSTVESAMLNATTSMTASQMSISDSSPMKPISRLSRVGARGTENQDLGEAFQFARNTSNALLTGASQEPDLAKQRESLMSQWHAALAPFDIVSERNSTGVARGRSEKSMDGILTLDESMVHTSSSLSHALSSIETDSREGRTRGMSWDSGAFSLERQIERLRELESPEQGSESFEGQRLQEHEQQSPSARSRTQSAPAKDQCHPLVGSDNVLGGNGFRFPNTQAPTSVRTPEKSLGLSSSLPVVTPPQLRTAAQQQLRTELPSVQLPWITTQSPSPAPAARSISLAVSGLGKKASGELPLWLPRLDIEEAPLLAGTGFAF
ncbi:hypothetical protein OC846_005747 [Tilletia horrida]|uniref:Uncharacterized protein n=1 Tax=Tilletia horrida TaxID=155126 RepID=A0AAN6JPL7_9BASI|nr:hypothetical protein OC846_005747 [Tilletia horrida]KAK0552316.1 hypothetical protein OC845_001796 [Tilletia horrida]KAK0561936.1 hypothetical protein OC861_005573 [Tilletia horrida]